MSAPLLEVQNLTVGYGAIRAVKGISFFVQPGEMVALIGANGAGKTTTLKTLAGLLAPVSGAIHYQGQPLAGYAAHDRVRSGIALVPEGRGVFARLTVDENLDLGAYVRTDDQSAIFADLQRMYSLFPRLAERRRQLAGTLSGGEQQMLAIARALMSRPKLLLLDEPSMGLAPLIVARIFQTLKNVVADDGVTLLLVEQNARLALQTCQRAYVLDGGQITLSGPAADLLHNPAVRAAYLGELAEP